MIPIIQLLTGSVRYRKAKFIPKSIETNAAMPKMKGSLIKNASITKNMKIISSRIFRGSAGINNGGIVAVEVGVGVGEIEGVGVAVGVGVGVGVAVGIGVDSPSSTIMSSAYQT